MECSVNISFSKIITEASVLGREGPSFRMNLAMMGKEEVDAEVRREEDTHKRS